MDDKRAKQTAKMREWRAKRRALGLPTSRPRSEESKRKNRDAIAARRALAKERGERIASETWWVRNIDKHRSRVAKWRSRNLEAARTFTRRNQAKRRATPWGAINNRMWTIIHRGVKANSRKDGKYNVFLGYTWSYLRRHLESQFAPGMTWDNWGTVWELDHIVPLSSFKYTSLEDPLFKSAWALSNLRPLTVEENAAKGKRLVA